MKTLLLWLTFVSSSTAFAQKVVVAAAKQNVFYIGVPNPIDIAVEGYKCTELVVTVNSGLLEPTPTKCSYNYTPKEPGKALVSVADKQTGKLIGQSEFRTKYIPDPIVTVGGKQGGAVSKDMLKIQQGIAVIMPWFDFDGGFMVTSFSATIAGAKETTYEEKTTGPLFSSNLKRAFENLEVGDKVFFEDIHAKGPDGRIRLLIPIHFTITD